MLISQENSKQVWKQIALILADKVKTQENIDWNKQFSKFFRLIDTVEGSLDVLTQCEIDIIRKRAGESLVQSEINWEAFENTEGNMSTVLGRLVAITLFCSSHNSRTIKADEKDMSFRDNFTHIRKLETGDYYFDLARELVATERYLALTRMAYRNKQMQNEGM